LNGCAESITAALDHSTPAERLADMIMTAGGLCGLCHGSGHLMCHHDGKREFWRCPACLGAGVRAPVGPPMIFANRWQANP
jgi:hypothetical protein